MSSAPETAIATTAEVVNLDAARADANAIQDSKQEKKTKKRKSEDTTETFWARHVSQRQEFGVYFEDKDVPIPYRYDGRVWKSMSIQDTKNEAEAFMSRRTTEYSASKVRSCEYLFDSILMRLGRTKSLDKTRARFSIEHGLMEIRVDGTLVVRPHNINTFCRTFIPLAYDVCDTTPGKLEGEDVRFYRPTSQEEIEARGLFGKLVRDSFPDIAVRRAFQEALGDTLLPGNSQTTPFLIGNGGQGKSQWAILAMAMHPNHAVADLSNLRGFALASFIGASLLVVDEAEKKIDEAAFKRIFGGSVGVQVDRKFKTPLNWVPDVKGLCCVNDIPVFAEHSEGVNRRITPYPMTKSKHDGGDVVIDIAKKIRDGYLTPGANPGDEIFIPSQMRDLIDWALHGAIRVVKRGRVMQEHELPEACRAAKTELRLNADPVQEFVAEFDWRPASQGGITKQELYDLYTSWVSDKGRTPMNQTNFGRDMKRIIERVHNCELKDGQKISVKGPRGGEVWKPALRLEAHNPIAEVKGNSYVWDPVERAAAEAEEKRKAAEAQAAYELAHANDPEEDIIF